MKYIPEYLSLGKNGGGGGGGLVAKSCPTLAIPWTVAHQDPLSMGFSRQKYWSGFSCPPPGDLPDANTESSSRHLLYWQAGPLLLVPPGKQVDFNSKPEFESQLY